MAGLLDIFSGMDKATAMGLLQAGAQMMQDGAPSATPTNLLGVLGGGANGFLAGYGAQSKEEKEAQDKAQEMALKNRLADATINKDNATAGYYGNGGAGADGYHQPIQTSQGWAKWNPETKDYEVIKLGGNPALPVSADPNVAFNVHNATNAAGVNMVKLADGREVPMQNKTAIPGMLPNGTPPTQQQVSPLPQPNSYDLKNPNGIDYTSIAEKLLPRVIQVESGGNSNAVSSKGAEGITQIMPATGANPGYGIKPLQNNSDEERMRFTKDYLTTSLGIFNGDVEKAIASYNQGINGVQQNGIDKSYVNKVLGATDTNPFIAKNNPITTNAVNGVKMAVENGTAPHDAIHQGVKMLDDAKTNLQAVGSHLTQSQPLQIGQSTADKLAAETAAKQQQDLNSANIKKDAAFDTSKNEQSGQVIGTSQANTKVALPSAIDQAQDTYRVINDLENHPGLNKGTGLNSIFYTKVPGSPAYDFKNTHDQLVGKTFMQAFNSLRGAGAITDTEGKAATAAISKIADLKQSPESYKKELAILKNTVNTGLKNMYQKAGVEPPANNFDTPNPNAGIDDLVNHYKKMGQ